MVKTKIYPNYWNYYYYDEGYDTILLVRKVGEDEVYRNEQSRSAGRKRKA